MSHAKIQIKILKIERDMRCLKNFEAQQKNVDHTKLLAIRPKMNIFLASFL